MNKHEWINCTDHEGNTPLHYAAFRGSLTTVQLLETNGADGLAANKKGLNCMHFAAQGGSPPHYGTTLSPASITTSKRASAWTALTYIETPHCTGLSTPDRTARWPPYSLGGHAATYRNKTGIPLCTSR